MSRWRWALLVVMLACIPIWLTRSGAPSMMADTDTVAILQSIEARKAPLSWFAGDWPLANHFYRPVTTLVFELDHALHPSSAAGFGATNALIAIGCVLVLFWFLRELTDRPFLAGASASLFAVWVASPYLLSNFIAYPLVGLAALGFMVSLAPGRRPQLGLAGVFAAWYAAYEIGGLLQVRGGSLDWIPGRTATTMTLFALAAMAAYARCERTGASRDPLPEPSSQDRPATKGTSAAMAPSKCSWVWGAVALVFGGLAFGSYEQAVMLPACLLGVAISLRLQGLRVRWGWQAGFWGLLLCYLLVRRAVIPPGTSTYQLQQYRSSWDVLFTILDYLAPAARGVYAIGGQLDLGFFSILLTQMPNVGKAIANGFGLSRLKSAFGKLRAENEVPQLALAAYLLSAIAFLPMAWLKPFPTYNHYHFWSMGLRSLFAVTITVLAFEMVKRAVTPRAIQAPARHVPAPGSLPRR